MALDILARKPALTYGTTAEFVVIRRKEQPHNFVSAVIDAQSLRFDEWYWGHYFKELPDAVQHFELRGSSKLQTATVAVADVPTAFTREEILQVAEGNAVIRHRLSTRDEFGPPRKITRITCLGEDATGRQFVCGYHEFGRQSEHSFSLKEGSVLDFDLYSITV